MILPPLVFPAKCQSAVDGKKVFFNAKIPRHLDVVAKQTQTAVIICSKMFVSQSPAVEREPQEIEARADVAEVEIEEVSPVDEEPAVEEEVDP
jgi:hypothetical protein